MLKSLFGGITRLSVRFWPITLLLTLLALVFGGISATRMNQELLPNLEFPQTFVITFRPGASSEDLRDLITLPLEQAAEKIAGVIPAGLESTTTAPVSVVIVRNEYGRSQADLRADLQTALDQIIADGVPVGLKTTADLTPALVTRVLQRAPSMFKHFEASHLLAMSPDVLNAALQARPELLEGIDQLTREQLAAARLDVALNGVTKRDPVALPPAWAFEQAQLPRVQSFNLSALPVLTSSISSTDPKITPEELKGFVEKELIPKLKAVQDVADVSVSGGQQIPKEVMDAALIAVKQQRERDAAGTATPPPPPAATPAATPAADTPSSAPKAPALPDSWRAPLTAIALRAQIGIVVEFNTAADLLAAKDASGQPKTAADVLNAIAIANPALLRELSPAVLSYLRTEAPTVLSSLSDAALENATAGLLRTGVWTQILAQPGFAKFQIATLTDLAKIKGDAASTINSLVSETPKEFSAFATRLAYSISPEAFNLWSKQQPTFTAKLNASVVRDLPAETLKLIPEAAIKALDTETQKAIAGVIADPSTARGRAFEQTSNTSDDDPNAPPLPEGWVAGLRGFGLNVTKADGLLKKPFGLSAAEFINSAGGRNPESLKTLDLTIFTYLASKDPTFYAGLSPTTLGGLSDEVLAQLPPEVVARAQRGDNFTPTTTITRADSRESLTLSILKTDSGNTVIAADGVEKVFEEIKKERPDIQIGTIFGQAEFIKESISGVAREGGLGALMAVIVILLFLNFSVRSTLVTAVSIPASVAIAFVLMYTVPPVVHNWLLTSGQFLPEALRIFLLRLFPESITLNIMTLSGLTVAVGRVVDDSIVVLENIYRQLQANDVKADRRQVVLKGTRDVTVAIFAATMTTVVVFLPIGLTGGVVGQFFLPFGLAVTYALGASFIVAITLVPLLAFFFITRDNIPEEKEGRLEHWYHNAIEWSLSHRWAVLGVALGTMVVGLWLFSTRPLTFLPSFGEPQITVAVALPPGTKIAATDARVREMETYLKALEADKRIRRYQTNIGGGGQLAAFLGGGSGVNENNATVTVAAETKNLEDLNKLTQEIRAQAEQIFTKRGARVSRASISEQGFGGFALVAVGSDADLKEVNDQIKAALATVPGLTNITSTLDQVGGASAYLRIGQKSAVQYSGELETQDTIGITNLAIQKVQSLKLEKVTVSQGFQSSQQTEGFQQTFVSMGIAIAIVYFVMVLTFSSLVHPFTILFSLPLAIVGAALGLTLTNRVLGLSALIGLLMLIGIVVTNAIVMIDRVQQNRKEHKLPMREALIEGARTRLRPILMTAIATIFALLPLAVGLSEGAIIASELGTVVIGGLFSSTILTLLVVPVIYSMIDAVQQRFTGKREA